MLPDSWQTRVEQYPFPYRSEKKIRETETFLKTLLKKLFFSSHQIVNFMEKYNKINQKVFDQKLREIA